jgi:signal transduction histidine kinase
MTGKTMGILAKLLISFLIISSVPLIVLGYIANSNLNETGLLATRRAEEMGASNLAAAEQIGKNAIEDSVLELDKKSTEAIELRTVELAQKIADFLYERDRDIFILASLEPDPEDYLKIYQLSRREVILPESRPPESQTQKPAELVSRNPENRQSWRHRPPNDFNKEFVPLYREITLIDLKGQEQVKVKDGKISNSLIDVSKREETYSKAEDYFGHLGRLQKGEIYVSRLIGPYVNGWLHNTTEGIKVRKESAYAGKENPNGRRFEGIIRWATPVFDNDANKIGYVTFALDHRHLLEFTDHVVPSEERFSELPDAGSGNYAFVWDDRDRNICHPREFFICGYDPQTGEEVPGWLSEDTYGEYLRSGLTLGEFAKRLPSFRDFSQKKRGSTEQMKAGRISLDCRILDTAPQCQGWHEGTEDGGSGSFLIFWSGLWKLTTYATIPYYTGPYGNSKRGFGYVTVGANVDEFHKAASITKTNIQESIRQQGRDIETATLQTRELIENSSSINRKLITIITLVSISGIIFASVVISLGITKPLRRLSEVAVAMSRGDLNQSIEVKSRDEVGQLAKSFNEMAVTLSEVDKMKSEFVTIASHELRTPIQAMLLGVSGILEGYSGKIDEEVREDLLLAKDGIERLTRLVQNLLDLSRIEARKIEFDLETTSVVEIIDKAVEQVFGLTTLHNHAIIRKVPQGIPKILTDKDRIIQVLVNLLSNSIKYTPDGGKIVIGVELAGSEVIFSVADNGYGIPLWAQEEVFKKFFQADSVMSQKVGGCGLGLTISKGIVEEHGGSILCESPILPGQFSDLPLGGDRRGTVFVVRLPIHGLIGV